MTGGNHIRAIGPEEPQDAQSDTVSMETEDSLVLEEEYYEEWQDPDAAGPRFGWLVPTLAVLAIAGWTGFYGWANRSDILAGGTPQQWSGWIIAWAIPVLLVVSLWMLAIRNSRHEAARFGAVARTLSNESALLEERLKTVNRELSLAREFLSSQSRELESLGRVSSERLSTNAEHLQSLIMENSGQIDTIASVSDIALENMSKLRDELPVIANSAKDVSNQIGTAGRTAHGQIAELVIGFERLNDFGKASETQVGSIQEKINAALAGFEAQTDQLETIANERFGALREKSDEFRGELDSREVEAIAAIRRRADALADEFKATRESLEQEEEEALRSLRLRLNSMRDEAATVGNSVQETETKALDLWQNRVETLKKQLLDAIDEIQGIDQRALESANAKLAALTSEAEAIDANIAHRDSVLTEKINSRRETMEADEAKAIEALGKQLAALDQELAERREKQLADADTLAERSEGIAARIDSLRTAMREVAEISDNTQTRVAQNADALASNLERSRSTLGGVDEAVAALTDSSVRLLELIQASTQHSQQDLPKAIAEAEARLEEAKQGAVELGSIVEAAGGKSEELSNYVIAAQATGRDTIAEIDTLRAKLVETTAETTRIVGDLRSSLSGVNEESDLLSRNAQTQLRSAISALEEAARTTPQIIESEARKSAENVAGFVAAETSEAMGRTIDTAARGSLKQLEEAASQASNAGRDVARQLRDQLAKIDELAGNLETRVARAREQAEEQVGNDFARRVALITESLNSNAIDISKAVTTDVSDTAWASYLRGDRGIFTRRAVRLLDNTEARDIAQIYDDDAEFRENVSRYIHDFEAMLRTMLSTRDGNALGVTLLSSDMGKLYVALAQAIERLRD